MADALESPHPGPLPRGGPLAGITVVDLTSYIAGSYAAMMVGDLGARLLAANTELLRLQALDLSDNLIGDAGAAALARAPGLARLTGGQPERCLSLCWGRRALSAVS